MLAWNLSELLARNGDFSLIPHAGFTVLIWFPRSPLRLQYFSRPRRKFTKKSRFLCIYSGSNTSALRMSSKSFSTLILLNYPVLSLSSSSMSAFFTFLFFAFNLSTAILCKLNKNEAVAPTSSRAEAKASLCICSF